MTASFFIIPLLSSLLFIPVVIAQPTRPFVDMRKDQINHVIVGGLCCALKSLLFPAYHSTDFEVHRNWLAITNSLQLKFWYFENTSEWTLDYPPFFAYFEKLVSYIAAAVEPGMVQITNLNFASDSAVQFQRTTVIATDIVLLWSVWKYCKSARLNASDSLITFLLVAFNAGLLIVDHIHFQYNGMLFGVLILCLNCANRQHHIGLAAMFSLLVLLKHLFVPLAPLFGLYLLKVHCGMTWKPQTFLFGRFLQLVVVAGGALVAAFGPFFLQENGVDQMKQIFMRLFPFGRGLVHAYWAPNLWALYCLIDKGLGIVGSKFFGLGLSASRAGNASTSGLVGDFQFAVLPQVSAAVALSLVLLSQGPAFVAILRNPTPGQLLRCVVYCSLCSFMVGYHVHEKAVLVPLVVLTLLTRQDGRAAELFMSMSVAGVFGLFPLLPDVGELGVKSLLLATFVASSWALLRDRTSTVFRRLFPWVVAAFVALFIFTELVHPILFRRLDGSVVLPFLPLLLTSCSCAVALAVCWYQALLLLDTKASS